MGEMAEPIQPPRGESIAGGKLSGLPRGGERMKTLKYLGLAAMVVILGAVLIAGCSWFKEEAKPTEGAQPSGQAEEGKPEAQPEGKKVEEGKAPQAKVSEEAPALTDIFFDFDKYNIRSDQRKSAEQDVSWLRNNGKVNIIVEGHCDERGTSEYNMALGERRAKAVKDFLVSQGISAKRIKTISYGKEKPFDPGHSEEAWAKNRRGHFVIQK